MPEVFIYPNYLNIHGRPWTLFMITIGGGTDVVNWGRLKIWAENGFIRIEDAVDGSTNTITVKDALERMNALSEMLMGSKEDSGLYYDEIMELRGKLESMVDICRKAKEQGTFDDPSAVRDLMRRRPKSISMSSSGSFRNELAL